MSSTKKRKVETSEDVSKKAKHLSYLAGFGNLHESSALPSALPVGQNNPQRCPYGLYAEQLSGSAFTKQPRSKNLKSWLYRIQPSVQHSKFVNVDEEFPDYVTNFHGTDTKADPNQMRWMPIEAPKDKQIDFLHGLKTMGGIFFYVFHFISILFKFRHIDNARQWRTFNKRRFCNSYVCYKYEYG